MFPLWKQQSIKVTLTQAQHRPVVIVGAPRSGTNMLRDCLAALPGMGTWPCDEINYIWRHGHALHPDDEFPASFATPAVATYIRRAVARIAAKKSAEFVIEKTCANSLRVEFVREVLPDAHFVFIYRDGVDVVASAMMRWKAPLDIPYLLAKARFIPPTDMPLYAARYALARAARVLSPENRVSTWGPRFKQMDAIAREVSLPVLCALQWQHCIDSTVRGLGAIGIANVTTIRYEDFVAQPLLELQRLTFAISPREYSTEDITRATSRVRSSSVGNGIRMLEAEDAARVREIVEPTRRQLGYAALA